MPQLAGEKQMNKQHQLPGVGGRGVGSDLQAPTPWHTFHTKSAQIEVDTAGVETLTPSQGYSVSNVGTERCGEA